MIDLDKVLKGDILIYLLTIMRSVICVGICVFMHEPCALPEYSMNLVHCMKINFG